MAKDDLISIDVQTGVNDKGKGFITVIATTEDKRMFLAQLDPKTCRKLGHDYLEAAEAAETDAIVYRLLSEKFGLELPIVGAFVADMRNLREE